MRSAQRLAWVLLMVGGIAAVMTILGPGERWGGVDIGATGGALLMLSLGAGIVLFAKRGDEVFPDHMSVSERRAWVGLAFMAIILTSYFHELWMLSERGALPDGIRDLFTNRFMQKLFMPVVAWSAIAHLIGSRAGGVESDERDLRLRHHADRAGDWAFTLIVIAGICVLALMPASLLAWWLSPIVLANLLIGLLIAKSLVEHVVLAFAYRTGRA
jgi:hypothetical protein